MTDRYETVKMMDCYDDYVTKKIFPHVKELEMIVKFNKEMESYKREWSRSQFEDIEEIE